MQKFSARTHTRCVGCIMSLQHYMLASTLLLLPCIQVLQVLPGDNSTFPAWPTVISFAFQVEGHVEDAKAKGAKVLIGGSRPSLKGKLSGGYFFEPTVIGEASVDMKIFKEETFGPAIPCFRFKADAEAVKLANDTEYGLAAYFYTKVGPIFLINFFLFYFFFVCSRSISQVECKSVSSLATVPSNIFPCTNKMQCTLCSCWAWLC